jgi:hypothetical protein
MPGGQRLKPMLDPKRDLAGVTPARLDVLPDV